MAPNRNGNPQLRRRTNNLERAHLQTSDPFVEKLDDKFIEHVDEAEVHDGAHGISPIQYSAEETVTSDDESDTTSSYSEDQTQPASSPIRENIRRRRRSDTNQNDEEAPPSEPTKTSSWYEFDLSVVVALVSPIGNWLTGGDHVKNLLLLLLLIFYLHQVIEIPWALYHSSRPRKRLPHLPKVSQEDRAHQLAVSELRALELFFLTLTVLSPVFGAFILRYLTHAVSGTDIISWFSTTLFILATGIRPWKHVVDRLRQRTSDLHDFIHYPPAPEEHEGGKQAELQKRFEEMMERVEKLEKELGGVKTKIADVTEEVYDYVDDAMDTVESTVKRHEKKCEASRESQDLHLSTIQHSVEKLRKAKELSVHTNGHTHHVHIQRATTLTDWLSLIFPGWLLTDSTNPPHVNTRSPNTHTPPSTLKRMPTSPSRLETIPEEMDMTSFGIGMPNTIRIKPPPPQPIFRIPGLNLVLRVGDLATLPLRTIVHYLLSTRVYSSKRKSSP